MDVSMVPDVLQNTVDFLNKQRKAIGISALQLDSALTDVARKWVVHLAAEGRLDHGNFSSRIGSVYPHRAAGECLAEGPRTGRDAVNLLMEDRAHRVIMLSRSYRLVGIGMAPAPIGGFFWVFDFSG